MKAVRVWRDEDPMRVIPLGIWSIIALGETVSMVPATPPTPPAMDQGRVVYEQRCLECYGLQSRDDGVKAPFLSPHPGNLVLAATSEKSDKYLLKFIANGRARTAMLA